MTARKVENFRSAEVLGLLSNQKKSIYKKFGVIDMAVFGSYARNEQKKESDVDIVVKLKQEYKTFDNFIELRFFLEEILGKKVDLVTREAIREELQSKIFSEAINV